MERVVNIIRDLPENRGVFISVYIGDIHFGVPNVDPKLEYQILKEQFIDKISDMNILHAIFITGDLFDRRVMANSDTVYYTSLFIQELVEVAIRKQATILLLKGTDSHDSNQLKLFYHYLEDYRVDFRIVETIKFEIINNVRILCIPELYDVPEYTYDVVFKYSGLYDQCVFHGTVNGSVYGNNTIATARLFDIEDFKNCCGPIIGGHVHTGGCFSSHIYYTGSPIRYKFGEENPKGFLICVQDLDTHEYITHLEEIKSFRYDTILLDDLINTDPKDAIAYINSLKQNKGIDFLKVKFLQDLPDDFINIINSYYKNKKDVKICFEYDKKSKVMKKNIEELDSMSEYNFILDKTLTEYDILTRYINIQKGYEYISVENLKKILEEDI